MQVIILPGRRRAGDGSGNQPRLKPRKKPVAAVSGVGAAIPLLFTAKPLLTVFQQPRCLDVGAGGRVATARLVRALVDCLAVGQPFLSGQRPR